MWILDADCRCPCEIWKASWLDALPARTTCDPGNRLVKLRSCHAKSKLMIQSSVPVWKFVANHSTGTKYKRVCSSLILVCLLPRRAEVLVMSMCHELTTQDTRSRTVLCKLSVGWWCCPYLQRCQEATRPSIRLNTNPANTANTGRISGRIRVTCWQRSTSAADNQFRSGHVGRSRMRHDTAEFFPKMSHRGQNDSKFRTSIDERRAI